MGESVTLCMKTTLGFYADSVLTAEKDDKSLALGVIPVAFVCFQSVFELKRRRENESSFRSAVTLMD